MEQTLQEFRAGRMRLEGGSLCADTRKGLLRLVQTEDTLVHVQWYARTAAGRAEAPEEDVIVFPGEAQLDKIPGQRAVVLKFPEDPSRNMFFWLQEPRAEADDELVSAFSAALNRPPSDFEAPMTAEAAADGITPTSALEHAHVTAGAGAGAMMSQGGGAVGQLPTAPAQTPGSLAATNAQASGLAAILGNAIAAGLGGGQQPAYGGEEQLAQSLLRQLAAAQQGARGRAAVAAGPSLAEVVRPELLLPVLRDPATLAALAPHLPEEHRNTEALVALVHSPQWQQQLASFSGALRTGQLDMSQFGLRAAGYSVSDFLAAIQELVAREAREAGEAPGAQGQGGQGQGGQGEQGQGGGGAPMEQ